MAFRYLGTDGAFAYTRDEILDNAVMNIGFEQCQADFPHGSIHIGSRKFAPPSQPVKNPIESSGKRLEHSISSLKKAIARSGQILA